MPCYQPQIGGRDQHGTFALGKDAALTGTAIYVACGKCVGCRQQQALAWTIRCTLENQQHKWALFTTWTYNDANLPPTLNWTHGQLALKRLRQHLARRKTNRNVRFFAAGEYGETTGRPHYHAIIWGLNPDQKNLIEDSWQLGHCRTYNATPGAIAYTVGYTFKKWNDPIRFRIQRHEPPRLDPTGTYFYRWVAPFHKMSRNPGIGAHAKQWPQSWRSYAVINGTKASVPRYLHQSWLDQATEIEKEELEQEKYERAKLREQSEYHTRAAELAAQKLTNLRNARRGL